MMVRTRCQWAVACLVATLVGSGCLGEARDPLASTDGRRILRVAYERELDVLNAFTSQMLVDIQLSMVEGLITTDQNNTYVPVLAPLARRGAVHQ
jgi:hypothetical protein